MTDPDMQARVDRAVSRWDEGTTAWADPRNRSSTQTFSANMVRAAVAVALSAGVPIVYQPTLRQSRHADARRAAALSRIARRKAKRRSRS